MANGEHCEEDDVSATLIINSLNNLVSHMALRVPFLLPSSPSDSKNYGFVAHCSSKFVFAYFAGFVPSTVDDDFVAKCRSSPMAFWHLFRFTIFLIFLFCFFVPLHRHQILNKHQCFCSIFQYRENERSRENSASNNIIPFVLPLLRIVANL